MATLLANNRNKVAVSGQANHLVVNDHVWDIQAAANNDYVHIGELPAFHKICPQASGYFALADGAAQLAAMTFDVHVGEPGTEATANKIFSAIAITADTEASGALDEPLIAEKLGVSDVNRKVYVKLTAAPATAEGKLIVRLASFPFSP